MQLPATVPEIAEAAELAALCGWENVRAEGSAALVKGLQEPLGAAAPPAQQALSDVYDFNYARDVVNNCAPDHAPLAPIDVGHATPPSDDERSAADAQVYTPVFTSAARAGGRERESEREGESESERERGRESASSRVARESKSRASLSL